MSKNWFTESNRYKHFYFGVLIGLGSDDLYCAIYTGAGVAGALEFKDKSWGGKWDWLDWGCTVAGVALGYGIRYGLTRLVRG